MPSFSFPQNPIPNEYRNLRISELFPELKIAGINFIARSPLSRGLLSRRFGQGDVAFDPGDLRSQIDSQWTSWIRRSIEGLGLSEDEFDRLPELAVLYCLSHENTSAVIPGINSTEYLQRYLGLRHLFEQYPDFAAKVTGRSASHYPHR